MPQSRAEKSAARQRQRMAKRQLQLSPSPGERTFLAAENEAEPRQTRKRSMLEIRREMELRAATYMRGNCNNCGHNWRPRNPHVTVNRCPACSVRGVVAYEHIPKEEVLDV